MNTSGLPIGELVKVLDHGYCTLIESWGSDEQIIAAARMSTNKGFQGWGKHETCDECTKHGLREYGNSPSATTCRKCQGKGRCINKPGDEKLLKYLWDNRHATPFEMAGLTIEVQAPIMVFREWLRHRTQSYSELSARYSPLPDVNYVPTPERCLVIAGANKQANAASGAVELTHDAALAWLEHLAALYEHSESVYQSGLRLGVPKELARLAVTVGRYSRMRASANLRNWLAFLTLRSDCTVEGKRAQYEIRQYANVVASFIQHCFPRTHALYVGVK